MAHFVDTNIVVYAYDRSPRAEVAIALLRDATISVQVLNEFTAVCLRKLGHGHQKIDELIVNVRSQVAVIEPLTEGTHDLGRDIASRHRLSFYDSLLLASALLADCDIFYSEDMQHGLVIEGVLKVRNPFA